MGRVHLDTQWWLGKLVDQVRHDRGMQPRQVRSRLISRDGPAVISDPGPDLGIRERSVQDLPVLPVDLVQQESFPFAESRKAENIRRGKEGLIGKDRSGPEAEDAIDSPRNQQHCAQVNGGQQRQDKPHPFQAPGHSMAGEACPEALLGIRQWGAMEYAV